MLAQRVMQLKTSSPSGLPHLCVNHIPLSDLYTVEQIGVIRRWFSELQMSVFHLNHDSAFFLQPCMPRL